MADKIDFKRISFITSSYIFFFKSELFIFDLCLYSVCDGGGGSGHVVEVVVVVVVVTW